MDEPTKPVTISMPRLRAARAASFMVATAQAASLRLSCELRRSKRIGAGVVGIAHLLADTWPLIAQTLRWCLSSKARMPSQYLRSVAPRTISKWPPPSSKPS